MLMVMVVAIVVYIILEYEWCCGCEGGHNIFIRMKKKEYGTQRGRQRQGIGGRRQCKRLNNKGYLS